MTKTIQVTERDILNGLRGECDTCPVALALRRAFPKRIVTVWYEHELWTWRRTFAFALIDGREYRLPDNVLAFISAWDDGENLAPPTFQMEVPNWL